MLALSRREGERIVIGGNIVIEIHKIRQNRVVVTVSAPNAISIDREEVSHRRQDNVVRTKSRGKNQRRRLLEVVREMDVSYARRSLCFERDKLLDGEILHGEMGAMTH
jgi:carbon storage regulator CsrA